MTAVATLTDEQIELMQTTEERRHQCAGRSGPMKQVLNQ